jgi:hypothetical protein
MRGCRPASCRTRPGYLAGNALLTPRTAPVVCPPMDCRISPRRRIELFVCAGSRRPPNERDAKARLDFAKGSGRRHALVGGFNLGGRRRFGDPWFADEPSADACASRRRRASWRSSTRESVGRCFVGVGVAEGDLLNGSVRPGLDEVDRSSYRRSCRRHRPMIAGVT